MSQFPMDQGAGAAGYSPLSFYDKPSVLVEQLLDGDASWASVRDTLFNSDKLAPKERDTLADRIRSGLGVKPGPSLANGLIEAATNPLTWMVLLTAPQGMRTLAKTGSLAGKVGVKGLFPILQAMGLTVGQRTLDRLGMEKMGWETVQAFSKENGERALETQRLRQLIKQGTGLEHIEEDHPLMQKLGGYLALKLNGHDTAEGQLALKGRRLTLQKVGEEWKPYGFKGEIAPPLEGSPEYKKFVEEHEQWQGGWVNLKENLAATQQNRDARKKFSIEYEKLQRKIDEAPDTATKRALQLEKTRLLSARDETVAKEEQYGLKLHAVDADHTTLKGSDLQRFKAFEAENPWAVKAYEEFRDFFRRDRDRFLMKEDGSSVDGVKYHRAARGLGFTEEGPAEMGVEGITSMVEGDALARLMSGRGLTATIRSGAVKGEDYLKAVEENVMAAMPRHYGPQGIRQQVELTPEEKRNPKLHTVNAKQRAMETVEGTLPMAGGSFITRVEKEHAWHDKDVKGVELLLGEDSEVARKMRAVHEADRARQMREENQHPVFVRRNPLAILDTYQQRAASSAVMDHSDMGEFTVKEWEKYLKENPRLRGAKRPGDLTSGQDRGRLADPMEGLIGGPNRRDYWVNGLHLHQNTEDKDVQLAMKQVRLVFEAATGGKSHTLAIHNAAFEGTRAYMGRIAESAPMKWLESNAGNAGRDFVGALRKVAEDGPAAMGRTAGSNLARFFYTTHLGINMGAVALNTMQPLLFVAPHLGMKATLKGFAETLQQFYNYGTERAALGRAATAEQRLNLIAKHFPMAEELGIQHDAYHMLDEHILGGRTFKDSKFSKMEGFMLKPFELSERWNRVFTGNMVKAAYKDAGHLAEGEAFAYDVHRFVSETQYGSSATNTPRIFMDGWLSHPLMRQFSAFPLRTLTTAVDTLPNMTEGSFGKAFLLTNMRAIGASAIAYEMLKGTFGADASKALYASSVTDLVGGDKFLEKGNDWIYVPPVISVPKDMIAAISQDDHDAYAQALSRVVPGGVALSKVLGVLPEIPGFVPGIPEPADLQKTYIDWSNPGEDGMYPMYSWDGKLVEFKSKLELYQRAVGLDAGKWTDVGKFDNYMVKQREQILRMKRQYLTLLSNGDYQGADKVKAQFKDRYGVDLVVGRDQVKAFTNIRTQARSERILDRLPPEVKAQFQQMMQNTDAVQSGLTPEQLQSAPTASGRDRSFQGVDPAVLEEMQRRLDAVGPAAQRGGFAPFGGF